MGYFSVLQFMRMIAIGQSAGLNSQGKRDVILLWLLVDKMFLYACIFQN